MGDQRLGAQPGLLPLFGSELKSLLGAGDGLSEPVLSASLCSAASACRLCSVNRLRAALRRRCSSADDM
jgi:hypothetical protein